jgi:hypothetical protein
MTEVGITKTVMPVSQVVTDEFIEFANNFDHRAVERYAKSLPSK